MLRQRTRNSTLSWISSVVVLVLWATFSLVHSSLSSASTSEFIGCKVWDPTTETYSLHGNFEILNGVLVGTSSPTLCRGLVDIPEGVTEIANLVFAGATEIKEVKLPSTMRTIGYYAFQYSSIETVTAQNGLETIQDAAFQGSQVTHFDPITSIKSINYLAFSNTLLKNFNFSNSIEHIGNSAFQSSMLGSVKLKSNISYLGESAFADIPTLKEFEFPSGITEIPEGILALSTAISAPVPSDLLSSVTIPNSVTKILTSAFLNRNTITNMVLSTNLKEIGYQSLFGTSISSISLPSSLETLTAQSLFNTPLTTIRFNNGIKYIGDGAVGNTLITKAYIPSSVEFLHPYAFYGAPLRKVIIGKNANFNAGGAFWYTDPSGVPASEISINYCPDPEIDSTAMMNLLTSSNLGSIILGDGRDFSCSAPDIPVFRSVNKSGTNTVIANLEKPFSDGGSQITKVVFTSEDLSYSNELDYAENGVYVLVGFTPGQSVRLKTTAVNAVGISNYSELSNLVTTDSVTINRQLTEEEQKAIERELERLREISIQKAIQVSVSKMATNERLNLDDFQNKHIFEVNASNLDRIQDRITNSLKSEQPSIAVIKKAVNYVVTIDKIVRFDQQQTRLYAQNLVDIGLIPVESKSKHYIWYVLRNTPADARKDEASITALIQSVQKSVDERKKRLAEQKLRFAPR
jgi:hypothetical protein